MTRVGAGVGLPDGVAQVLVMGVGRGVILAGAPPVGDGIYTLVLLLLATAEPDATDPLLGRLVAAAAVAEQTVVLTMTVDVITFWV
jgi:hypothetical protein